jgi:uncharacterized DUF497 family protein
MRFEWNESKSRTNLRKHGISFELAAEVFSDPFCLTIPDPKIQEEQRFWTIGRIAKLAVVLLVYTICEKDGEEIIRIISARKATPRERRFYEEVDG